MLDTHTSIYKPRSLKKSTTEEFIPKAILVHGDRYDYSLVDYKNSIIKVTIFCPIHGEFQQSPSKHLSGQGCTKCKNIIIGNNHRSNKENFIIKSLSIHGEGKYNYSKVEYINNRTKVIIICPIHGEFLQTPNNHLRRKGCPKCYKESRTTSTEQFIEKSIKVHGEGRYNYSLVDYINPKTKVNIICSTHNLPFEQTPSDHLSGCGCPKCANDATRIRNNIKFENRYNTATLYLLKCFNVGEAFLKIGITSRTIKRRYHSKISMPYEYETLYEWQGDSKSVVELEDKVKSLFLYHKPEIMFDGGRTETLHISQEKTILKYLDQLSA